VGRRLLAAAACLATAWIGTTTGAWAQMLAILGALIALIALDARDRPEVRSA
jgi:hypothetical protein